MSVKTKYCSECGQKINPRRARVLPLRLLCPICKPRFSAFRFAWFMSFVVCLVSSFLIGRYTAPAESFNFIGTPIELAAPVYPNQIKPEPAPALVNEDLITSCGAPTKAGHPCRRKVHGWGYCWQHRDKLGKKPLPKEPELLNKIEKAGIVVQ